MLVLLGAAAWSAGLELFARPEAGAVALKWVPDDYSGADTYRLYRTRPGEQEQLQATLRPLPYETLLSRGYSEDTIYMIQPMEGAKTPDERIRVRSMAAQTHAFRLLRMMTDEPFSENLGLFYRDASARGGDTLSYRVEQLRGGRVIADAALRLDPKKPLPIRTILWVQPSDGDGAAGLDWAVGTRGGFYRVYRKKSSETAFSLMTEKPKFVSPQYAQSSETLYRDTTLKAGESAEYYVVALDMFGAESLPSATVTAGRKGVDPKPAAVTGLFIKATDKRITLRWKAVSGALTYDVYRADTYYGNYTKRNAEPLDETVWFDREFESGRNYYYYVTATNMHGSSKPGLKKLASSRDATPPPMPEGLRGSSEPGRVLLEWNKVAEAGARYRVYTAMDPDASEWSLVERNATAEPRYVHDLPETLSRFDYYYRVTSVDAHFNESAPSNIVKVRLPDVTPPKAPVFTEARSLPGRVELLWRGGGEEDVSHFNLYRKKADGKFVRLNEAPLEAHRFTDSEAAGPLLYAVTAVDAAGNESIYSDTVAARGIDNRLADPEALRAERTGEGIVVSFDCPGAECAGFEVYRSSGNDLRYFNISGSLTGSRYVDSRARKDTSYFYKVRLYDASGNMRESRVLHVEKEL